MRKIINWFKESNRWKHILCGVGAGIWANSWYCVEYGAIGTSCALELKDLLKGDGWDFIDMTLTIIGFNLGYLIRFLII